MLSKPSLISKSSESGKVRNSGFTLIELLIALAIGTVLILSLSEVLQGTLRQWRIGRDRDELLYQARFALDRMIDTAAASRRILLPLQENPATVYAESVRPLFAVTLPPGIDRDEDGFADADNDKDGLVDEDLPADNTFDNAAGIIGIDDNGDGFVDEGTRTDNDEDGQSREDGLDGLDNDGDLSFDEDPGAQNAAATSPPGNYDNDGDGLKNEDWYDPVVYYVNSAGTALIERLPDPGAPDGSYFSQQPIAEADTVLLQVQRLPKTAEQRAESIHLSLQLTNQSASVLLEATVRIGGGE